VVTLDQRIPDYAHEVSAKYLALYVAEFQFRYNNRANADIFGAVIGGC
jgi:hypothetical protein